MADDPETKDTEGEGAPKKKSKLMLFIGLGVGIALLGGGGFFAYTKFLAHKPAVEAGNAQEEKATGEEKGKAKEAMGEMLVLEPFVVNLADPKGKRYLKIRIELEIDGKETMAKAEKLKPKMRDTVIMMLTSLSFEEVMSPEGKIRIRDELMDRFNQIMKPERIQQIYFTDFVVQ
ncbi:MAG: flagellar basal body protein FliL [Deltaproteobacteria bacterium CG23_combo_of_CG06-09_8_20_14_all_60_8]|nr:MAG: flagellar basal body protein FliL [Desulfobacterales bacterium CG2_30_60_27]PIP42994.1 MAG: flagellar basal body protein FliL [Deltaproteobacteria bacterium CG23_combo_of_CG06-09_8_20_14_all_60_8]